METKQKRKKIVVSVLALAGLLVFSLLAIGGDLEPSAPPGPTMKTLDEVEPRIPIPASASPAAAFVINSPGSYYLTGDRNASGNGVEVNADNVTIDLMGYSLIGPGSGTNYGIYMNGRDNVEIRNGTVRDFSQYGIYEGTSAGRNHRVIGVRAFSNGTGAIYLKGYGHLVKGCTAYNNGHQATGNVYGIYTESGGSTVTGNRMLWNGSYATGSEVYGIYASGEDNTVTGNTVRRNGHQANTVYGIRAGDGSTVTGNTAGDNGYAAGNTVYGIRADKGSTVTGNTAGDNGYSAGGYIYGIWASYGSTVTGNTAYGNGYDATNADRTVYGIFAWHGCTVTGNTVYGNGWSAAGNVYGIYLAGDSLVDQNTAYKNGDTNMNTPASCTFGTNHAP